MKTFLFLIYFALCMPVLAAEAEKENPAPEEPADQAASQEQKPEVLSCQYYTVKLPDDWKTVMPPTESHGNVKAIFANKSGNCVVTITMGPTMGQSAKTIAAMFAEQFKAQKPPLQRNNGYEFTFTQHNGKVLANVSVANEVLTFTTIFGNQKTAQKFLKAAIIPVEAAPGEAPAEAAAPEAAATEKPVAEDPKPEAAGAEDKAPAQKPDEKNEPKKDEAAPARQETQKPDGAQPQKAEPGKFTTQYYDVSLSEGWRAIMPPTEEQGNLNAIFAKSANTVVTIIVGPNLGADGKSIADMFAEQFKAKAQPRQKNGGYSFSFQQNGAPAQALVTNMGEVFMLTITTGNSRDIKNFLANDIKSENYADLVPSAN